MHRYWELSERYRPKRSTKGSHMAAMPAAITTTLATTACLSLVAFIGQTKVVSLRVRMFA